MILRKKRLLNILEFSRMSIGDMKKEFVIFQFR